MRNEVKVGRLKNGFTFYSLKGTTYISGIGCRVGSIHNPYGKVGMQHLVEHLLARRSPEFSVRQANFTMLKYGGGSQNIRTDKNSTFFGHDLVMRKSRMIKIFNMLSSIVLDRIIEADDIKTEKAAIRNEFFQEGKDNPQVEIGNMLEALLFANHPAGSRVDCELDDLKLISSDDIKKFINKYYVGSNMFGLMFGPSHQEVAQRMRYKFGHLPEGKPVQLPQKYLRPFRPLKHILTSEAVNRGLHQTHVAIGVPIDGNNTHDQHLIEILKEILEFRLFERLRGDNVKLNQGTYGVHCTIETSQVHGIFYTQFASTSKRYAEYGEEVILEEMNRLCEKEISIEEFDVVTTKLKDEFLSSYHQIPYYLTEMVIEASCNDDVDLLGLHRYTQRLRSANRKAVQEAARKYFSHGYARAIIKPR